MRCIGARSGGLWRRLCGSEEGVFDGAELGVDAYVKAQREDIVELYT